jgi:uncharacterized membrane protein YccF (DUF307 family)
MMEGIMVDQERLSTPVQRVEVHPPNLLLRVIWFLLIGWWLTGILSAAAWALNATVIGLPLGLWIINRLPTVATLVPPKSVYRVEEGVAVPAVEQRAFLLRAIYFILIGWWFSGLWMAAAYVLLLSVIGIPAAFWMYGRIGAVTSLYRS